MKKLSEFEKSGMDIKADIKFDVLHFNAFNYLFEDQWDKNYTTLLELEELQVSDARSVLLQQDIARTEYALSPCNFQSALRRFQNALEVARGIYPRYNLEVLSLLLHITIILTGNDKFKEAKPYAEEMMDICNNLPAPTKATTIAVITAALRLIGMFDPYSAEIKLVDILKTRWPHIYSKLTGTV